MLEKNTRYYLQKNIHYTKSGENQRTYTVIYTVGIEFIRV